MKNESRVFLYGSANFTRASIPEILADFGALPTVDIEALSPEAIEQYGANLEAYRLFVLEADVTLTEIRRRTGVHQKQLYRLLDRVVSPAADNQIQGLRGLIPGKHLKAYTRVEAVRGSSKLNTSSAAGALQQLLRKFPAILDWIRKEAKKRNTPLKKDEMRQVKKPTAQLHGEFLDKCHTAGVNDFEWPFNQDYRGYRSFVAFLKKCELEHSDRHPKAGDGPGQPEADRERPDAWPLVALQPFSVVQFDGHKVDLRVTIAVPDPFGMERLIEISRIWILVVTDVRTRAILGYANAGGELWWGVVGPAKIPQVTMDKLNAALREALSSHDVQVQLRNQYVEIWSSTPDEFSKVVQSSYQKWNKLVKEAAIEAAE